MFRMDHDTYDHHKDACADLNFAQVWFEPGKDAA